MILQTLMGDNQYDILKVRLSKCGSPEQQDPNKVP